MAEAGSAKKQNSACHFCDHAARRSGRYKVAEQVACSLENCRKVFCSRRACIAKLRGPGVPQTIEEFRQWKDVIERGEVFFVCPHCVDQNECQGPQCKKRGQVKQQIQSSSASTRQEPSRPVALKRSYGSLSDRAGSASPVEEEDLSPVLALTTPYAWDLMSFYETSIQQYIGTAPFDYHRKRRKSGSFEVIAPVPIRLHPLAGQFQGLKIQ